MSAGSMRAWSVYRRVLPEMRRYRLQLFGILMLSLLSTPLALLAPVPLKIAVDSAIGSHPPPGALRALLPAAAIDSPGAIVVTVAGLTVLVAMLNQLRSMSASVLRTYTGQQVMLDLRARLFGHVQHLSLDYHDSRRTSESTYRIQVDASEVKSLVVDGLVPFVSQGSKLLAMLYVTALIDLKLAMVALVIAPVLLLTLHVYGHRLRGGWQSVKHLDSSCMSIVQEVLGGLRVVKAFGQEERERERFMQRAGEKMRARVRLAFTESWLGLLIGLIVALGTALVLALGVNDVRSGDLTLGNLLLVLSYLSQLYRPLESISERIGQVQSSLVSAERVFELLDHRPEVVQRPAARRISRSAGDVRFDLVSFSYDGAAPVLEEVSFAVPSGTSLGIAGATGAGKTTIASLLMRFYDPNAGRILLDEVDLRDYDLADLRRQFALVLQEPVLFSTSVAENIAYARPDSSFQDIVAAAEAAHAHDFITELSDGYDTTVGERGMRLSGGERQRVSLARAFLKDAPVLILDEPTSSVDVHTESLIMEAMESLMGGRTTLMIAHRVHTLDRCDARILFDQGRVLEVTSSAMGGGPGA